LDEGHGAGAEAGQGRVVVSVLLHVERVPVLGMGDAEDEVDHLGGAVLGALHGERGLGVDGAQLLISRDAAAGFGLGEHARAVGESIADRGAELPGYRLEDFLKFRIEGDMLVDAEVGGQIFERLDFGVGIVLPFGVRGCGRGLAG
jgi:hypothetical protein